MLQSISFRVKPGQTVAIVGQTGAGKTSLVKLINRTYDATHGQVLVDGVDVRDWNLAALRSQISMVTQDTSLLHRSIRDNIRYGCPGATDEDVVAAAKLAHAHEFILDLEDWRGRRGYDAHVGERGVKLSGGQKQRIAIARALLADPRVLVLDEATSNLDAESEALVQQTLSRLMHGRTTVVVAHRLSTVRDADRIAVVDGGRIVEQGSHDELMAAGGRYAELFTLQARAYLAR